MDAIILAGGRADQDDPLYPMTKGGYKSMLDIAEALILSDEL